MQAPPHGPFMSTYEAKVAELSPTPPPLMHPPVCSPGQRDRCYAPATTMA